MPERAGANAGDDEGRRFSAMAEILDRRDSRQRAAGIGEAMGLGGAEAL